MDDEIVTNSQSQLKGTFSVTFENNFALVGIIPEGFGEVDTTNRKLPISR
jgi:hypothetical protein